MDITGKRLATRGFLKYDDGTIRLQVKGVGLCDIEGLEDCQTVFGTDVIFIGDGIGENRIRLKAMDDTPTEDNCDAVGGLFIPMITDFAGFCSAIRTELCSSKITEEGIQLSTNANGEHLKVYLKDTGRLPKNENDLEQWLQKHEILVVSANAQEVKVDEKEKTVEMRCALYTC